MNRRNIVIAIIGIILAGCVWYAYSLEDTVVEDVNNSAKVIDVDITGSLFLKMGSTIALGIYLAIICLVYVIPMLSEQIVNWVFSNPREEVKVDIMRGARSFIAQGEYDGAIAAFRHASSIEPDNLWPWVEIAKIQKEQFGSPGDAAATYAEALESYEWAIDDAVYFMFRISELQVDELNQKDAGMAALKQVIELFPETRHAANAQNRLRELEQADV